MAVYYKFKSAKDYDSIPIDSHFISVLNLKERIFESKHLGRGNDHDLEVTNAQTNEEYLDEAMLIPKNTSVLVRRVPGRFRMPNVTQPEESKVENKPEADLPNVNFTSFSNATNMEPPEWDDEFGHDLYTTIPEVSLAQASNGIGEDLPPSKADEDNKIRALIETPALDWQSQGAEGFGSGRGFGRGGRMMGGRGFGRFGERKTPPQGYVCHRCKVPGHFIQHCPTNGDHSFDIRKVTAPTGIPKTMLMANPDGNIVLPSGAVGVLQPNEAAFEKAMEGIPSTRFFGDLPPEFHCPLCKDVMKDAVLTSIRDYLISKSICVCGVRDVLADDLLPNKTLRDTINRIMSSTNSSGDNAGSAFQAQDMESSRCLQPKVASPTQSAAVKEEHMSPTSVKETPKPKETENVEKLTNPPSQPLIQQTSDNLKIAKVPDISEATHESASAREPAFHGTAPPAEEEVQQKLAAIEVKKKKKKKMTRLPINGTDMQTMQWRTPQDFAADSYMMPMAHPPYNPYWNGMQPGFQPGFQPGMDGYMGPFGGGMPYNMGYGVGPMDMPFPGPVPHDPYMAQNLMYPNPMMPPQRNLGRGGNIRPPPMTREEFEARKADGRRKHEIGRLGEREIPKDRDHCREVSSNMNASSMKSKPNSAPNRREPSEERYERDRERERERHPNNDYDHHRPHHSRGGGGSSKRKPEHSHHQRPESSSSKPSDNAVLSPQKPSSSSSAAVAAASASHKSSVFARISFPEKGGAELIKKRKRSPEPKPSSKESSARPVYGEVASSSSMGRKSQAEYESSDEDRHFKRKPSRYREKERDSVSHSNSRHR
ncbi:hypothetical protein V2J09_020671 [Rumex salicifolius]